MDEGKLEASVYIERLRNSISPGRRTAERGRIKGAALREFLCWYADNYTIETLNQKIAVLDPEVQNILGGAGGPVVRILASKWYPAQSIHMLLDQIVEGVDDKIRLLMIRRGAEAVMKKTLHGVYKLVFLTMMSPELYARFAQKLWSRYYDTGIMTKQTPKNNVQITTITEWHSHHPVICDLNYEGSRCIFEAMGCKNVTSERTGCISTGHNACSFVVSWSDE